MWRGVWGLVAEDFFGGDAAEWGDFFEGFDIEFLFIAENDGAVWLSSHVGFLKVHHVSQLDGRQWFIHLL